MSDSLDRANATYQTLLEDRVILGTVSGIWTTKPAIIEWVDKNIPEIELITSKSYQVMPNPGNREPIIVEVDVGNFGNAVGLRNPGMEQGYKELKKLRQGHNLKSMLNVSLSGNSIDDFILLVKRFEDVADMLELNFSCPHAKEGFGSSIGCDAGIVAEYMKEIRTVTNVLLFPKLTPNVDDIAKITEAALLNGADGIVAINTHDPTAYLEPNTGTPILYNPKGHKGGKSGEWIKEIALDCVSKIRGIDNDFPIIAMGGVTTGEDVKKMKDAGASVVGIGSVIARVTMDKRPKYFAMLKKDAENGSDDASQFVSQKRIAEYKPYLINKIIDKDGLRLIEVEGRLNYESSQFAFLWLPNVGEKPFSIAKDDPLTFVIREREYDPEQNKGIVTHALFELKEGDELIVRGVYGAKAPENDKKNVYIVAGGTGIAVVPKLAKDMDSTGKNVKVYYGMTSSGQIVLRDVIEKHGDFIPVSDNGIIGRVLNELETDLREKNLDDACFYNIGPVPFMEKAMELEIIMGVDTNAIYSSIETNNMCGIGMCGECICGDKLTCQDGTFFSLEYLREHRIDIKDL